jgi:hypothetical protein
MPIRFTDLLKQVPRETESRLGKTREATRNIIQELLRSECRLQLKVEQPDGSKDPGVQVPIEITAAYPLSFENIEFPDDHALFDRIITANSFGYFASTWGGKSNIMHFIEAVHERGISPFSVAVQRIDPRQPGQNLKRKGFITKAWEDCKDRMTRAKPASCNGARNSVVSKDSNNRNWRTTFLFHSQTGNQ